MHLRGGAPHMCFLCYCHVHVFVCSSFVPLVLLACAFQVTHLLSMSSAYTCTCTGTSHVTCVCIIPGHWPVLYMHMQSEPPPYHHLTIIIPESKLSQHHAKCLLAPTVHVHVARDNVWMWNTVVCGKSKRFVSVKHSFKGVNQYNYTHKDIARRSLTTPF